MKIRIGFYSVAIAVLFLFCSLFVNGQVGRTWGSGGRDDANQQCSKAVPCKTFLLAFAKTPTDSSADVLFHAAATQAKMIRLVKGRKVILKGNVREGDEKNYIFVAKEGQRLTYSWVNSVMVS